jgi:hypothetical protein
MFQTKVVEKIKTRLKLNNFFPEDRAVNEIMLENMVEPDRPQMTVWLMRTACWMPQTATTHTQRICNNYCFSSATMVA